jgi:hypothetical protein
LNGIDVFQTVPQLLLGVNGLLESVLEVTAQRGFQLEKQFKFFL